MKKLSEKKYAKQRRLKTSFGIYYLKRPNDSASLRAGWKDIDTKRRIPTLDDHHQREIQTHHQLRPHRLTLLGSRPPERRQLLQQRLRLQEHLKSS